MRPLLLAAVLAFPLCATALAAPDPAQEALASTLELSERRILGAVLADQTKAELFAIDAGLAQADPSKKPALTAKWRAEVALFADAYARTPHPTNEKGKSLKEMVEPSEWAYLMTTLRLMEPGWMKDQVISMIENANADLKKDDPDRALSFIKMARGKASGEIEDYKKTQNFKDGLAEAGRRKEDLDRKAKEQAEQVRRSQEKPKGKTPEEVADKSGKVYDQNGSTVKDEAPVIVPEKSPTGSAGEIVLKPSNGSKPSLTVSPPSPGKVDDDEAELKKMKGSSGGLKGRILAIAAPIAGGALGAVIGFFLGGPLGAVLGGLLGAAAFHYARKAIFH